MPLFQYKKLVRDNIWKWHEAAGHSVSGRILQDEELKKALCNKLHEEADEVNAALTKDELIEEIADIRQILDDLSAIEDITENDVAVAQKKKFARKGGFLTGSYIDSVEMPDEDDEWVGYCRKDPVKYPEIEDHSIIDPVVPRLEKGTYRHSKSGRLYEVFGVALDTETHELLVIYRPLYDDKKYDLFARPYDMFIGTVELNGTRVPRFEKVV